MSATVKRAKMVMHLKIRTVEGTMFAQCVPLTSQKDRDTEVSFSWSPENEPKSSPTEFGIDKQAQDCASKMIYDM
jgi:hypothetical protein